MNMKKIIFFITSLTVITITAQFQNFTNSNFCIASKVSISFNSLNPNQPIPITFESQGNTLNGMFFEAKKSENIFTFILLHGFPGNEKDVLGLGQKLSFAGINVLTFNYSGTHHSEGEFSMENSLKDIKSAYDYIQQADTRVRFQIDTGRIILGGYSYGGGMALIYSAQHPEIRRVISISGTDHGEFAREYNQNPDFAQIMDSLFDELKAPKGPVNFDGRESLKKLAENPDPVDLRLNADKLAKSYILLTGALDDKQVTVENHLLPFYRDLKKAGADKVTFIMFQSDHSYKNVRDELASQIVQWIQTDSLK
jgi:pimeloyl-ACP methyl ester carboxylesterase